MQNSALAHLFSLSTAALSESREQLHRGPEFGSTQEQKALTAESGNQRVTLLEKRSGSSQADPAGASCSASEPQLFARLAVNLCKDASR